MVTKLFLIFCNKISWNVEISQWLFTKKEIKSAQQPLSFIEDLQEQKPQMHCFLWGRDGSGFCSFHKNSNNFTRNTHASAYTTVIVDSEARPIVLRIEIQHMSGVNGVAFKK